MFFYIFDIYYLVLKIVTYVMSYNGYASLVKVLLKFELIKAHLSSFKLFSAYLGSLICAHLGLFWAHIKIVLNIFRVFCAHLGPFKPILTFDSFRRIYTGLSSFRLI